MWFLISEIIFQFICLLYLLMHLLIFSSFFIKLNFLNHWKDICSSIIRSTFDVTYASFPSILTQAEKCSVTGYSRNRI